MYFYAISKLIIIHKLYHVSFYVTPCARKQNMKSHNARF